MKRRAVFLDRDGTINEDPGYLGDPGKFRLLPSAAVALRRLRRAGYRIVVVSNQSGIARGLFDVEDLKQVNEKMERLLRKAGVRLEAIYCCPHHPDERCACRKPSPKMVRDAAREHDLDLRASFFIGDRRSDIETGRNAGCRTVLVLTGAGKEASAALAAGERPDHVAGSLAEAAAWILENDGRAEAARKR